MAEPTWSARRAVAARPVRGLPLIAVVLVLVSACVTESQQTTGQSAGTPQSSTPEPTSEPTPEPTPEPPLPHRDDAPPVPEDRIEDDAQPYELPEGVEFVFDDGAEIHRSPVLETVRLANQRFREVFGVEVEEATIFVFSDIENLAHSVSEFLGEPVGHLNIHEGIPGQAWPRSIGIYTGVSAPNQHLMTHELFHVLQFQLMYADGSLLPLAPPAWLSEGSAEYAVTVVQTEMADVMRDRHMYCLGADASLGELEDPPGRTQRPLDHCLGYHGTSLLVELSGVQSVLEFWTRRGEGQSWQQAFADSFGIPVEDFYRHFDEWRVTAVDFDTDTEVDCEVESLDSLESGHEDQVRVFFVGPTEPREVTAEGVPMGARGYRFAVVGIDVWQDLAHHELSRALTLPAQNVGWGQAGRRAANEIVVFMGPRAASGTYRVGLELPDGRMADTEFQHPC